MNTRIVIADRQEMFREVLRRLLESQADFSVIAETDDGQKLLDLVSKFKPDVILLDPKLRKLSGIEALQEIASMQTEARAIFLTDTMEPGEIVQILLWGARGIVRKEALTNMLFKSIRAVMSGQYWINHEAVAEVVQNLRSLAATVEQKTQMQAQSLSDHQQKIIEAIVAGCSNKEIAKDLAISERTVKYHLTRIFEKFGVSGRMELARFSLKNKVARQA